MRIGLVGGGFPAVRGALEKALLDAGMDAEVVDVPDGGSPTVPGREPSRVDVLVPQGGTVDASLLDATGARLVQQFGVGLSGVDLDAARARGVPVSNVPGAESGNATSVAEIALLHLLALLRRFGEATANVAHGVLGGPPGRSLAGRTVGVLGTGDIGVAVATRLRAFGAVVVGIGRRELDAYPQAAAVVDAYHRVDDLTAALARCDDLVVCCPLTEATRGLVGAEALAALGGDGYLVNVARGGIVDRDALLDALRSGRLAGAGRDVTWTEPIDPDDELLELPVTVTPHVGGVTIDAYAGMAAGVVAGIRRHLRCS